MKKAKYKVQDCIFSCKNYEHLSTCLDWVKRCHQGDEYKFYIDAILLKKYLLDLGRDWHTIEDINKSKKGNLRLIDGGK